MKTIPESEFEYAGTTFLSVHWRDKDHNAKEHLKVPCGECGKDCAVTKGDDIIMKAVRLGYRIVDFSCFMQKQKR